VRTFYRQGEGGSLDAVIRSFWCKKYGFFENNSVFALRTDKVGVRMSQCGHFADKRVWVNFSQFCADIFYGRPLSPYFAVMQVTRMQPKI